LKILVISQYFWPENFRINDLATELFLRGHEVTVLTGLPNYPCGTVFKNYKNKPSDFSKLEGVEIVRVPMVPRGKTKLNLLINYITFALSGSSIGLWKLRGRDFDVIFTNQLSPVTVGIPALILGKFKKAPIVFWVLDLWPDSLKATGTVRSAFLLGLVGCLVKFIYKRCDLILAQAQSFIPYIRKFTGDRHRIEYFPSWSENIFDRKDVAIAPEIESNKDMFTIIFAGNIGESQDFPSILNAVELLQGNSKIRWFIIGEGRKAHWLRSEIENRGLGHRIRMLGNYPLERMSSFYCHADALLVSLKDEPIFSMTIPGKLQSYLASGLPILAMINGEGARIINESGCGLTCPAGDYHGLAEAVLAMSKMSESEKSQLGQSALIVNNRMFGRARLIEQLERWFSRWSNDY